MSDVLNPIKSDLMLSVSNKVEVSAMDFKKTVDAQAENELRSLLQQEDLFTKNLFGEKLKKEVSEKIGAFLNQLSSEQIEKIYEGLSEQDKSDLEKVFELAKLENDLHKMKQREINALIDLTKAGLNDLNHQVLGKVTELYAQGNYQQALDTALILAKSGENELKLVAYQAIKSILRNTPQEESLNFLDKTLSLSDRQVWMQKMEQNIVGIRSEKDMAAYKDTTIKQTSAFELDTTKAAQEISEKKALKKASKELQKILKKLNDASALSFMEKHYEDIRKMTDVEKGLTKKYLLDNDYFPKNGKEIKDSELQAMKNLFYYKWNYTEDAGKKNQAENQVYEQIKLTKIAGVSMAEVHQAKEIMNQISTSPREAIKVLLGDKNRDGKITNITSEQGERRENVDQGTFFGGQIAQMYENAIARYGEAKVVENIMKVIQNLHGLSEFKISPLTEKALVDAFKASPAALVAFRKKLTSESDSGMSMLYAGTEYVKIRINEIKSEQDRQEKIKKVALESFNNPENAELIDKLDDQLKEVQEKDLKQALENLKKIKKSAKWFFLKDTEKEQIDSLIKQLSPEALPSFLQSEEMVQGRKNLMISGIGAAFSAIEYQGEKLYGMGAGVALTSPKINTYLQEKFINTISSGIGLYRDSSGFSLLVGLSAGGSKELRNGWRCFYGIGVGGNILKPGRLGFNLPYGIEKLINSANLNNSLDKKAAQYLGVVVSVGGGIDLSDPNFNPELSLTSQGYWRQDKLEGIEIQTKSLQEKVKPIFEELLGKASSVEAIAQTLQKKFPKTRGDIIYETAVGLYNTIKSYEQGGQDVKDQLSSDFAQYLAQNWRNENIEEVVKEGWHISQLGVGANASLAKLFTGFFGIGSLAATKYTDAKYVENKEMLDKAVDGMNDIHNFEQITNKEKTLAGKLKIINTLLRTENLLQEKPLSGTEKNYISLSPSVFDAKTSVRVMCAPELAPYMHYKDGELQLPFNADISVGKILHQGRETRVLILGKKSLTGTKEISLNADKVEFTEKVAKPEASQDSRKQQAFEFGTQPLDAYNLIEKTVSKETPVQLDGKPSDELVTYLEQNGGILVDFRHGNGYKKFMTKMASWDRNSESLDTVKSLLPSELQKQVTTVDDVRFVFASLSRVSQTRDKQLEHSDLAKKANEYLKAAGLQNNENLKNYIEKVGRGSALDDAEWAKMKQLLKIPNGWHHYNIENGEDTSQKPMDRNVARLFHILTPVKKLAEARTSSYADKITKEYKEHTEGSTLLLAARSQALEKLQGRVTAKGMLEQGWIGAVAGYESADHIDDKFVGAPKMIEGSMVDITGVGLEAVKRQYLTDLASADKAQFDHIKAQILAQIDAKDTSAGANALRNAKDNNADFIDVMLTAQTTNDKGEKVQLVNFDMKYGFFADCVNETLLLGNLKVQTTSVEQKPAEGDVYYYDAVVTNDAVTRAKTVGMGVVAGRVSDRVKDDSGTDPTKKTLEDKSETDPTKKTQVTPDELQKMIDNGQLKEVNGQTILVNGERYNYIIDSEEGLLLYGGSKNIPADKAIPAYALKENNGKVAFYIGKYVPQEVPTPVESLPPLTKEIADAKKKVSSSFATQASAQTVHMNYTVKNK